MLVAALILSQQPPADALANLTEQRLDLIEKFALEQGAVGISVSIATTEQVHNYRWGYADRDTEKPVERDTLFRLGSISKPVAATLLMQLVDNGKVKLETGISEFVPGFDDKSGEVNLRRVLCHTSGIRHYRAGRTDVFFRPLTTVQALDVWRRDPLLFEPGAKESYSTHAYTAVVATIEKVSGESYPQYLRAHLSREFAFTLDVEDSTKIKPERSSLYTKAEPKALESKPREDLSWKYGGGGLECTANDLARFGVAVANAKALSAETRDSMWTRQSLADGTEINYGLGWNLARDGFAMHGGSQQGCSSFLLVDRERKIAVSVLINTQNITAATLADTIYATIPRS
ncbi:MAG: beta-lactamase family protein [Fimbriimonadaceae bacterium]|nr:beta-lactamase family protein [Fimbriimonadaceae bacterium]